MPVLVIAILLVSLLFGAFHDQPSVRQSIGVKFESGERPDVDYKIRIEGGGAKAEIRL